MNSAPELPVVPLGLKNAVCQRSTDWRPWLQPVATAWLKHQRKTYGLALIDAAVFQRKILHSVAFPAYGRWFLPRTQAPAWLRTSSKLGFGCVHAALHERGSRASGVPVTRLEPGNELSSCQGLHGFGLRALRIWMSGLCLARRPFPIWFCPLLPQRFWKAHR
jgi:hypothetical protein